MVLLHLQPPSPSSVCFAGAAGAGAQPPHGAFIRPCVCVREGKGGQTARRSSLHACWVIPLLPAGCAVPVGSWASPGAPHLGVGGSKPTHHTGEMELWECLWWVLVLSPWARDKCWLCWATEQGRMWESSSCAPTAAPAQPGSCWGRQVPVAVPKEGSSVCVQQTPLSIPPTPVGCSQGCPWARNPYSSPHMWCAASYMSFHASYMCTFLPLNTHLYLRYTSVP